MKMILIATVGSLAALFLLPLVVSVGKRLAVWVEQQQQFEEQDDTENNNTTD